MTNSTITKFIKILSKKLNTKLISTTHFVDQLLRRGITKSELKTLLTQKLKMVKQNDFTIKLISSDLTIIINNDSTISTIFSQHNSI